MFDGGRINNAAAVCRCCVRVRRNGPASAPTRTICARMRTPPAMMVLLQCTTFSRRRPALEHIYVLQQEQRRLVQRAFQTSCEHKMTSPSLMTSLGAPTSYTAPGGSILDATGTRFAGANVAYLRYCTSDGYIGNSWALHQQPEGSASVVGVWSKQRLRRSRSVTASAERAMPPQLLLHPRRFYTVGARQAAAV